MAKDDWVAAIKFTCLKMIISQKQDNLTTKSLNFK